MTTATNPPVGDESPVDPETVNAGFRSRNPHHTMYIVEVTPEELSKMIIDPVIQRMRVDTEIEQIKNNFNPAALGVLTVSERLDGSRSVLDGQQRREVILIKHAEGAFDGLVQVMMHRGLSLAEEAQLFLQLNFRRAVDSIRRYKTRLVAEDPQALGIQKILDELDLPVNSYGVQAIDTVDRIYEQSGGPERLMWCLSTIQNLYDTNRKGGCYDGRIITAFSMIHASFFDILDEGRFLDAVGKTGDRISKLQGAGRTKKEFSRGGPVSFHMAEVLREWYNMSRRRTNKLPAKLPEFPKRTLEALFDDARDRALPVRQRTDNGENVGEPSNEALAIDAPVVEKPVRAKAAFAKPAVDTLGTLPSFPVED